MAELNGTGNSPVLIWFTKLRSSNSRSIHFYSSFPTKIKNGQVLWLWCYGLVVALLDVALCVGICWVVLGWLDFALLVFAFIGGLVMREIEQLLHRDLDACM